MVQRLLVPFEFEGSVAGEHLGPSQLGHALVSRGLCWCRREEADDIGDRPEPRFIVPRGVAGEPRLSEGELGLKLGRGQTEGRTIGRVLTELL